MRSSVFQAMILLTGSLLAGLGFCALLPPFEGFDEPAHYSYIEQIAQTGSWPWLNDPMSAEVDDYLKLAPTPMGGRWSYRAFFQAPAAIQAAGAAAVHGARDPARQWHAGIVANWQGQHPPLYYALLAPIWQISKGWSIYAQLFLLRAVSYLLAWSGLVIVTVSLARHSAALPMNRLLVLGPALWPALFPMWFPEMARLGNDSLVLLLLALIWVVMRRALEPRASMVDFVLLGALCGLGLLAKATALPMVGALGLFLTWQAWRWRGDAVARQAVVSRLFVFCFMIATVAGWYYVKNRFDYGSFFLSAANSTLAQHGGLLEGLRKNFSLLKSIIGVAENVRSFAWSGTWSFIFLPRLMEVPLSILVMVVAGGWIWQAAKAKTISNVDAVAILTLGLFVLGLLANTFVLIALMAAFLPGAWYLHSLAPLLAPLVARGLEEASSWRWVRPLTGALVIYPLLFLPFVTAFYLFYFSGCLPEAAGDRRFGLTAIAACAAAPRQVLSHLSALGNPAFAIPLFGAGCVAMLIGLLLFAVPRFFALRPSVNSGHWPRP